jgi:hypothetical protein
VRRLKPALLAGALAVLAVGAAHAQINTEEFQLNGDRIALSKRGERPALDHNTLVISQAGHARYFLAAPLIDIVYRRGEPKVDEEPDLIVTDFSGRAHCCFTVHIIRLDGAVRDEAIPIRDSELQLDRSVTPPRLRFHDWAFAYWKTDFADSPAPLVILAWDPGSRDYVPDVATMRRPAPDEQALAAAASQLEPQLRANYFMGNANPALWRRMLDLIYEGNVGAALRFFDLAWPPDRPGKAKFLAEFTRQLTNGALWRRYRLGELLGADALFR